MGESIVLTGLAANDPVPGTYVQINFAQGPSTGSGVQLPILILANRTTSGSATPDTVVYGPDTTVPLQTEADMIALGGPGSEAHRMFRRITAVNQTTAVYCVFVTESSGSAATATITLTTTATANGTLRIWVGDEFVDTAITSGDTPTVIATNAAASINAKTYWAVTASNALGVLTITAKNKGLRGNWLRFNSAILGSGVGTTTSATTDAFFTGGTTADSNTTALSTILPKQFYYIVSAAEDASQFGALASQVGTQALPTTGIRQRCFAGSVDSLANVTTVATGVNNARAEIWWQQAGCFTPAELAANAAATVALWETPPNPRTNFAFYGNDPNTGPLWKVPRSRLDSALPTRTSIKSALNNGITPIGVNSNNTTYLVDRITTYSLTSSQPDYRVRPAHKVTVCDFFANDLQAKAALQNAGKRIADNPPKGGRIPGTQVVTPQIFQGQIFGLLNDYDRNDLLQNLPVIKAGTIVQRETNPTTRMSARIPLQVVDNLSQIAVAVDQVA